MTKTRLLEKLTDNLSDISDNIGWGHGDEVDSHTMSKVREALPNGHTVIDLHHNFSAPKADPDVQAHLEKHGYKISDYAGGIATTKKLVGNPAKGIPMQEKAVHESIGKVLQKTNAPDHVKQYYESDPSRKASKVTNNSGLKILISHRPEATTLKTSGASWHNESCMNAENGSNREYLKHDARHLTHEAFLIHGDDEDAHKGYPANPIARISLKRHVNQDDDNDSIYRPEGSGYGASSGTFRDTVSAWAEKHYPASDGGTYEKHSDLYDDDNKGTYTNVNSDMIKSSVRDNQFWYTDANLKPEHKDLLINELKSAHPDGIPEETASKVTNLNLGGYHADKLIDASKNKNQTAYMLAGSKNSPELSRSALERIRVDSKSHSLNFPGMPSLARNPKLSDEMVDEMGVSGYEHIPDKKLKTHHVQKIVDSFNNSDSGSYYTLNTKGHLLNHDQVSSVMEHKGDRISSIPPTVMGNKNFTHEHASMVKSQSDMMDASRYSRVIPNDWYTHSPRVIAARVLGNRNVDDATKDKAASEYTMSYANDPKAGVRDGAKLPNGSSKHFTDDQIENLAHSNHKPTTYDENFHDRLFDAHEKLANEAVNEFKDKHYNKDSGYSYDENDENHTSDRDDIEGHLHMMHTNAASRLSNGGSEADAKNYSDRMDAIAPKLNMFNRESHDYRDMDNHNLSHIIYHPDENEDNKSLYDTIENRRRDEF